MKGICMERNSKSGVIGVIITIIILVLLVVFTNRNTENIGKCKWIKNRKWGTKTKK